MNYEEPLFRPPSEAFSLILQVTIGCSHNACSFCGSYKGKKFRVKTWDEIEQDILEASQYSANAGRIFLADGNALTMPTNDMLLLLGKLHRAFPALERVTSYAAPKDILGKSMAELKEINQSGLKMLFLGVESGNEKILKEINKGVTAGEMLEAGKKAIEAGFKLSVTVLTGIGGKENSNEHAVDTALLLNSMQPHYVGALTLMPVPGTPVYNKVKSGQMALLNSLESLAEIKAMLENTKLTDCIFRCNHASNYLPLKGTLDRDRERLVNLLSAVLQNPEKYNLKPEFMRGL